MPTRIASYVRHHLVAFVALFVALGSGSAVAATMINGSQITVNSIPENRLTTNAITDLRRLGASAYSDSTSFAPPTGGTQFVLKQVKITTTQTGKLLILNALLESATYNNTSSAPVAYNVGVYVDGVPVPGTYMVGFGASPHTSGSFPQTDPAYGSLANVAAGTHTVTIAAQSSSTAVNYITSSSGRLIVVATG